MEEPDEAVLSYLEMKEKIRATRGSPLQAQPDASKKRKTKSHAYTPNSMRPI